MKQLYTLTKTSGPQFVIERVVKIIYNWATAAPEILVEQCFYGWSTMVLHYPMSMFKKVRILEISASLSLYLRDRQTRILKKRKV